MTETTTELITTPVTPPPAVMPSGWTLSKVAALVLEIAQGIYEIPAILKKYSLTEEQYKLLEQSEFFQKALEARAIEWNSATNTQRRLALEAAIYLEESLPTVVARMGRGNEPLSDVVALLKILSEIAGAIGGKAVAQNQGMTEKFKIVINMGADTVKMEKDRPMIEIGSNVE